MISQSPHLSLTLCYNRNICFLTKVHFRIKWTINHGISKEITTYNWQMTSQIQDFLLVSPKLSSSQYFLGFYDKNRMKKNQIMYKSLFPFVFHIHVHMVKTTDTTSSENKVRKMYSKLKIYNYE